MKQKVIVDTSIWIEYFRNNEAVVKIINEGLDNNTIYFAGPIIAELLQGTKNDKELSLLLKYIDAVPYLKCEMKDWADAGCISFSLRKSGRTIPLTDIIISCIAQNNNAMIFTKEKHFDLIPGIKLFTRIG